MAKAKRLTACFYRTEAGHEPVREWLRALSKEDKRIIGSDIMTVEYGWPIGMPTCRPLGNGLQEVRSDISDGRIARVIFCIAEDRMILLDGFIKKTQKTPQGELEKAARRMKECGL